jgi:hypothetical protein
MILHDLHDETVYVRKDAVDTARRANTGSGDAPEARTILTIGSTYLAVKDKFEEVVRTLERAEKMGANP